MEGKSYTGHRKELMMKNFSLSDAIQERFQNIEMELGDREHIVKLDSAKLDTWEFRDRKPFEMGSIDDLALSIKNVGQCQPIIVVKSSAIFRPKEDHSAKYVVIAGYRRWMACKKHQIHVLAIIRDLNFDQAISVLVSENEKENVSDYSKGLFYHSLLTSEKISQDQLSRRLNISPVHLSYYLSFSQVPSEIWTAVGDLSRVSAKTSATIRVIAKKGTIYVEALKSIGNKIAHGFGEKRIQEAVNTIIDKKLKGTQQENIVDHKIKFNGKVIMSLHQGRIKLSDSLIQNSQYDELVEILEKDITEFAERYLHDK